MANGKPTAEPLLEFLRNMVGREVTINQLVTATDCRRQSIQNVMREWVDQGMAEVLNRGHVWRWNGYPPVAKSDNIESATLWELLVNTPDMTLAIGDDNRVYQVILINRPV